MIVIPTYNGFWSLSKLIESIKSFGTNGHRIVIVDDKSTDLISIKYLDSLKDVTVLRPDTKPGYEAGCLVAACREFPEEEKVILIQDSCSATSSKWLTQFEDLLTPENVVTWIRFKPCLFFCNENHLEYINSICPTNNLPPGGFFGNIFMSYTKHIKTLDNAGYFNNLPTAKFHSEAWERIWPILFHINGIKTKPIIDLSEGDWFKNRIANKIHNGLYPNLRKTFAGRAG